MTSIPEVSAALMSLVLRMFGFADNMKFYLQLNSLRKLITFLLKLYLEEFNYL